MDKQLSINQRKAIDSILRTRSIAEASRESGINERTLRRWLTKKEFNQAINEAQSVIVQSSANMLLLLEQDAIRALSEILRSPTMAGASIMQRTAVSVLELSERYSERALLHERIEAIERALKI